MYLALSGRFDNLKHRKDPDRSFKVMYASRVQFYARFLCCGCCGMRHVFIVIVGNSRLLSHSTKLPLLKKRPSYYILGILAGILKTILRIVIQIQLALMYYPCTIFVTVLLSSTINAVEHRT